MLMGCEHIFHLNDYSEHLLCQAVETNRITYPLVLPSNLLLNSYVQGRSGDSLSCHLTVVSAHQLLPIVWSFCLCFSIGSASS